MKNYRKKQLSGPFEVCVCAGNRGIGFRGKYESPFPLVKVLKRVLPMSYGSRFWRASAQTAEAWLIGGGLQKIMTEPEPRTFVSVAIRGWHPLILSALLKYRNFHCQLSKSCLKSKSYSIFQWLDKKNHILDPFLTRVKLLNTIFSNDGKYRLIRKSSIKL